MYIFILLAFISSLFPLELLDHSMDSSDRKKTGVYKLSDKEKAILQKWIDTHYVKREEPLLQEGTTKHALLEENLQNGKFIKLSDQTLWEIFPEDTSLAQGWITPVEIITTKTNQGEHPYQLFNSLTGSSLRAKKTDKSPR